MEIHAKTSPLDGSVPLAERDLFARWAVDILGGTPAAKQFTWVTEWAYQVVVYAGRIPVSHLRIVDRTILLDDGPVRMGGVADLMTPPEHRRKGFASLALQEARRTIFDRLQARLGLLFCAEELLGFYARHGWQRVDCPVLIDQPRGKMVWPQCAMVLARPGEMWTPKSIDACGLPW